ncbi:MAG: triose-phosphate isomerase [Gammaproteobacteria bacterium]|nr:triose-phosphate isomerase [Gammaproteobacteria bacterium]
MRKPLVAGNWKMNGSREFTTAIIADLIHGLDPSLDVEVALCPPFVFLADAARALKGSDLRLGAQSLCAEESGAFTGEISVSMLLEFDCTYAIVGHSERRTLFGEDDALVARKFMAAVKSGLQPILCVGETLDEREQGVTDEVVKRQLGAVLDVAGAEAFSHAVVAYEPVWAIGTGKTASPEQAQEVHHLIRATFSAEDATIADSLRVLYGGSVKASNAEELFAQADIDGGLIGGASLDAEQFLSICKAAKSSS